jgi:hypothetical protein
VTLVIGIEASNQPFIMRLIFRAVGGGTKAVPVLHFT